MYPFFSQGIVVAKNDKLQLMCANQLQMFATEKLLSMALKCRKLTEDMIGICKWLIITQTNLLRMHWLLFASFHLLKGYFLHFSSKSTRGAWNRLLSLNGHWPVIGHETDSSLISVLWFYVAYIIWTFKLTFNWNSTMTLK